VRPARPDDGEGALQVAPAHVRVGLRGDRGRGRERLLRHQRGQRHGRARPRAAAAARLRERGLQVGQRGRHAQAERLAKAAQELPGLDHACAARRARASEPALHARRLRVAARRACEQRLRQQAAAGRQPGRRRHLRARQAQVLALRRARPRRPAAGRALRAPLQLGRLPLPARRRPRSPPAPSRGAARARRGAKARTAAAPPPWRRARPRARAPWPCGAPPSPPPCRPGRGRRAALTRARPRRVAAAAGWARRARAWSTRCQTTRATSGRMPGGALRRTLPAPGPLGLRRGGSRVGSPPAPAAGPRWRLLRCTAGARSAAYSQGARMRPQGEEQRRAPLARLRRAGLVRGSALARPVVLCGARRALARLPHARAPWLIRVKARRRAPAQQKCARRACGLPRLSSSRSRRRASSSQGPRSSTKA